MNLQSSLRHPHFEIPLALMRIQTRWLRKFYDEGEDHFDFGFNKLKAETDHLTPEQWEKDEDFYLDQRYDLKSLRELKRHFSIVGLFTTFEMFLRNMLKELYLAGADVPKQKPITRWYLDKIKEIFKEAGVPITEPDRDWNSIKKLQAIRNCITHLDGRPDKETVRKLQDYNCHVIKGAWMELPASYFEECADLVERICDRIVTDCKKAVKEKRVKVRAARPEARRRHHPHVPLSI